MFWTIAGKTYRQSDCCLRSGSRCQYCAPAVIGAHLVRGRSRGRISNPTTMDSILEPKAIDAKQLSASACHKLKDLELENSKKATIDFPTE